jgi:hypothetical protein
MGGWYKGTVEAMSTAEQHEMAMEQQPRQRASPAQKRQMTMQASQSKINQDVAIALERITGRLENIEHWRDERDDERRRLEDRKEDKIEKQPDSLRSALGTYGGCLANIIYAILTCISLIIGITGLIIALTR